MRKLIAALLALVVLAIGADFVVRYVATQQIGAAIATKLGLTQAPEVSLSGFPFLAQAADGEYDTISASLPPTTFGPVQDVSVNIDLLGVRIPLGEALSGRLDQLTAQGSQVRIKIPVSSISAASGLPNLQLSQVGTALRIGTTLTVFNQEYAVTADLDATFDGTTLQLRSLGMLGPEGPLPSSVTQAIGTLLSLDVPLGSLPFAVTKGAVTVVGTTLIVDATAAALTFATPGPTG